MKESALRIRVENQLRESFLRACKKEDLTAAQVLRAYMRSYIEQQERGKSLIFFKESRLQAT